MKKTTQNDQGSFAAGLAVGAVMGVLGYLMYGTSRGKELKSNFQKEFEKIRSTLYEEGVIESPDASIIEIVASVQQNIQTIIDGMPKQKRTYAKKSQKKFKGVK